LNIYVVITKKVLELRGRDGYNKKADTKAHLVCEMRSFTTQVRGFVISLYICSLRLILAKGD
jgi:hypothetical protein